MTSAAEGGKSLDMGGGGAGAVVAIGGKKGERGRGKERGGARVDRESLGLAALGRG